MIQIFHPQILILINLCHTITKHIVRLIYFESSVLDNYFRQASQIYFEISETEIIPLPLALILY